MDSFGESQQTCSWKSHPTNKIRIQILSNLFRTCVESVNTGSRLSESVHFFERSVVRPRAFSMSASIRWRSWSHFYRISILISISSVWVRPRVLISDAMAQIHAELSRSPETPDNVQWSARQTRTPLPIGVIKCFGPKDCAGNRPGKFIPQSCYFLATRGKIRWLITKRIFNKILQPNMQTFGLR